MIKDKFFLCIAGLTGAAAADEVASSTFVDAILRLTLVVFLALLISND